MRSLLQLVDAVPGMAGAAEIVSGRHGLSGLEGSVRAFFAASLLHQLEKPILMVVSTPESAEELVSLIQGWSGRPTNRCYGLDLIPYEIVAQSPLQTGRRLSALSALALGRPEIVVATPDALLAPVPSPHALRSAVIPLAVDAGIDSDELAHRLIRAGYEPAPVADVPGRFARRGGIIDVLGLDGPDGVRVELFGDRIASLRVFDPETQRTTARVQEWMVYPAAELLLADDRERDDLIDRLGRDLRASSATGRTAMRLQSMLERLSRWELTGLESLLPYVNPDSSLVDYLSPDGWVVLQSPRRIADALLAVDDERRERLRTYLEQRLVLPGQLAVSSPERVKDRLARAPGVDLYGLEGPGDWPRVSRLSTVKVRPVSSFFGRWDMFVHELDRWLDRGMGVAIVAATTERAERLKAELTADDIIAGVVGGLPPTPEPKQVLIGVGSVSGFELPDAGVVVVSDAEILGRPRRARAAARPDGGAAVVMRELKPGDYVVHVHHGVGRYLGLKTMEIEGAQRDYLFIRYAGEDRLYVPTDQVQLVQKYVGGEGAEPRLNRLGGSEWVRTRTRVRASIREMARELLEVQAQRQMLSSRPCGSDTPWQGQFEDAFPYEETPDQLRAIVDVKGDLERERPMDRLLCGDVGYGKTEVALRAAFKAIMSGRQVAFLVPTTVLAHQHFRTFQERFESYPVGVEMLSRFRSPAEQRDIIEQLRVGTVDLVVGTHRLLQADIEFSDLGLIVIDEEHRFGVSHKERLKQLYPEIDVLVLTATPIPRTLHMSLTGLRDISLMETPPRDRYPVQTFVVEFDPGLVAEVIQRELGRGGQVFYVHNRVQTMDVALHRLGRMVPEARVGVAHGQMREDELERVMMGFLDGSYDVLLCTTIIESGLDIPNVNTLVVEEADRFGLAQLYQLRGRVGRSNRLAFAYFTYRKDRALTEIAEKRLVAIREFTELGSGFRLAMRDLEIRGAGNLLGPEQHGFIVAVGFDMYCQLLEEAVRELAGRPLPEQPPTVKLELGVDAYLPDGYVPSPAQRIEYYRRLSGADGPGLDRLAEDILDSCGPMPPSARNLIQLGRIRLAAGQMGIVAIVSRRGLLRFQFKPDASVDLGRVADWAHRSPHRIRIGSGKMPMVRVSTGRHLVTPEEVSGILTHWSGSSNLATE